MSTPTPVSGARRLRSMSYESAFSGETYTMRTPEPSASSASAGSSARRARRSIPHRKAASVLPDPVGAQISVCAPDAMRGQLSAWAGVGAANESSNQPRTGAEKGSSADSPVDFASVANPPILRLERAPAHPLREAGRKSALRLFPVLPGLPRPGEMSGVDQGKGIAEDRVRNRPGVYESLNCQALAQGNEGGRQLLRLLVEGWCPEVLHPRSNGAAQCASELALAFCVTGAQLRIANGE